jgi:hypothetical protein
MSSSNILLMRFRTSVISTLVEREVASELMSMLFKADPEGAQCEDKSSEFFT